MPKASVMVIDDSRIARELFSFYINGCDRYQLSRMESSCDFVDTYAPLVPVDLVILDLMMHREPKGLEAAVRMKRICPTTRIIAVTSMLDEKLMQYARQAGIDSFWYKEASRETLLEVMDRTMEGESVYPDYTIHPEEKILQAKGSELTRGERRVLRLMTSGLSNSEIAGKLGLTEGTVKGYVHTLLEKTGCPNRTALAIEARISGIAVHVE